MRILPKLFILIILIGCKSIKTTQQENEKVQIRYESGETKFEGSYSNEYLPVYKLRIGAVSYTHLTLPTIYSV